jgi:hypothetical protein
MTDKELEEAYAKLRIARQKSKNFHKCWFAIMDAFAEFLDADLDLDKATEIADKYARMMVTVLPTHSAAQD